MKSNTVVKALDGCIVGLGGVVGCLLAKFFVGVGHRREIADTQLEIIRDGINVIGEEGSVHEGCEGYMLTKKYGDMYAETVIYSNYQDGIEALNKLHLTLNDK